MRSLTKKMHKGQKGLTLIELLIVVAILGIIAAVVIPNLGSFMVTGRISAANTELENVKTASLAFYAENEYWPVTSNDLADLDLIAGDLKAVYTFDEGVGGPGCETCQGWVTSATGDYSGITFNATSGEHGTWIRG